MGIIGAEPLSSRLNGKLSIIIFICLRPSFGIPRPLQTRVSPSVNCLNKRSCGLRPSNVLHFPSN